MKHWTWDYEESTTHYYHIYPCSSEAESTNCVITLDLERTDRNDADIDMIVQALELLAERLK